MNNQEGSQLPDGLIAEMRATFERAEPSDGELIRRMGAARARAARARLAQRASVRPRKGAAFFWILAGALGCGAALAFGVQTGRISLGSQDSIWTNNPTLQEMPTKRHARGAKKSTSGPEAGAPPETLGQEVVETDQRVTAPLPPAPPSQGAPGETRGREVEKPRIASTKISAPPTRDERAATAERNAASWVKVARSLNENNSREALSAIAELEASDDAGTRQAAQLLSLQLKFGRGASSFTPSPKEHATLEHLARSAVDASVQQSAERLLERASPQ